MTTPEDQQLADRIHAVQERAQQTLAAKVVTVMSGKGGVGKTLLAMELAYLFDGVLADLDWDGGRASTAMGYHHQRYSRAPLLDALRTGNTPVPKRMPKRPDLIPGHPEFSATQPPPEVLADVLVRWATEWKRPLVTDTHPGGSDSTFGALGAADVVVHPIALATRELNALEETLVELDAYPIILIPNEVPPWIPAPELERLETLATKHEVAVGPPIYSHDWYRRRKLRTVVTATKEFSRRTRPLAEQLVTVAERVCDYAERA